MYLIGIEVGTTRIKTGVYDIDGNQIREISKSYRLFVNEKTGKAEAEPYDWWKVVIFTLQAAIQGLDKSGIKGICVGSHGPSVVALDKNGHSIGNSIIWLDRRANREAELIAGKIAKKTNDLGWFVPRVLWLKKNKPEEFRRATSFIQPLDYINCKLTGELKTIYATDVIKIWNDSIINASGLDPSLFPPLLKMGSYAGTVNSYASNLTGIPAGVPVIAGTGGADFIEVLISSGTLKPGIVCDRGGTSQGVNLCWNKPFGNPIFFEAPHPLIPGLYNISGLMATTGKSLQWYKELFYGKRNTYDKFFNDAAKSPPGANKLIFLPYLTGERTPWWDSNSRGVFFGLSLEHQEKDIVRAILEGVGFGIAHILNLFKQHGAVITEIRAHGGQAGSPLWNQIKADITGLPVATQKNIDGSSLGLAIIAGAGTGIYRSISEAAENIVKSDKVYEPDPANHSIYTQMQPIYENLYPVLKSSFKKLSEIT